MSAHPLDRTAWNALGGRQAEFALGGEAARRFKPEIGPIAAVADHKEASLKALADLVPAGSKIFTLEYSETPAPEGLVTEKVTPIMQLTAPNGLSGAPIARAYTKLTDADAPEMLALALLTEPGPFSTATHHLGQFIGVKIDGQLVAMAGERMKVDGFSEVSGVCTHPDFQGCGYARMLSYAVAKRILERRETPFLHAYESNVGAIALYEKLGFAIRARFVVTVLDRP